MNVNPIIAREVRVRWRTWGAPALVLLLLTGLSLAMGAAYTDQTNVMRDTDGRAGQLAGRGVFMVLAFMQMGAWLLLAPMLTSMNIASERERGLLENLQLSPLRAFEIASGKLFSAAAFIVLVSLTALPVTGITFCMGGISTGEFAGAWLLNLLTALTGASIGVFFSARCRRPLPALILSLLTVCLWVLGGFLTAAIAEGAFSSTRPAPVSVWRDLAGWTTFCNPVLSLYLLMEPGSMNGTWLKLPGPADFPYWTVFPYFALFISTAALCGAARAVRKPFEPAYPNDRHWLSYLGRPASRRRGAPAKQAGAKPEVPLEERLMREIRLDQWVKFANPILQREVRGPFRFRRAKAWQGILQLFVAALAIGLWILTVVCTWTDSGARGDTWGFFINVWLFVVILTTAVWTARSFARERENGLFEGLWLSLLTRREVVGGKVLAPLLVIAIYSVPVLAILALSTDWTTLSAPPGDDDYYRSTAILDALCGLLIVVSTAFCVCAFGLFVSFRSARVTNAVITVIVSLIIVWAIGPVFMQSMLSVLLGQSGYRTGDALLRLTNPFMALNEMHPRYYDPATSDMVYAWDSFSWIYSLMAVTAGSVFCGLLLAGMRERGSRQ